MKLLEAENLTKTYRIGTVDIRALQGVSLSIEQGEFVAIMGPSGSGKSTMMHLLGFLDKPDAGSLRLMGKEVSDLSEEAYAYLRNQVIGFIFQQFNLMARSTAVENAFLPLLYTNRRLILNLLKLLILVDINLLPYIVHSHSLFLLQTYTKQMLAYHLFVHLGHCDKHIPMQIGHPLNFVLRLWYTK